MTPQAFRHQVRQGGFRKPTAGVCGDYAQANLAILPQAQAADFMRFCQLNPKPCPLLGVGEPGQWQMPMLGEDIDIRTDLPGYYVYRDGERAEERVDLRDIWQPDFVVFAIGCSFSFEQMLTQAGVPLRHIQEGRNVSMYRTNVPNGRAGPFGGDLVVSMRPMVSRDAIRSIQITSRFPAVHGAPIHLGDPALLGIADLQAPDYGDAVTVHADELPVFWACGVTPQEALRSAKLPLAITHKPGHMLVTDVLNSSLAAF
ncbi:MAG: putative hydro-lyase [Candidimonas sp.]|nr:MAG: putative hydro-lyase [Candidimonas sp.]